ncbi:MAG: PaaI family thioesterase [Victivallaceae bacterium]|nr:PaaI family thioesterase [Victivallaceae bacterium]
MSASFDEIKEHLNRSDRFCIYNKMKITVIKLGYAEAVLPISENTFNGLNTVQGGAIFTLSDFAFAGAANSYGAPTVAMNASFSFIRPGVGKELKAVASIVHRGRRTAVCDVDVWSDDGKQVAHGTITGFIHEGQF